MMSEFYGIAEAEIATRASCLVISIAAEQWAERQVKVATHDNTFFL